MSFSDDDLKRLKDWASAWGKTMTKEELIEALQRVVTKDGDEEDWHVAADDLILSYINDEKVSEAYHRIPKWYA